MTRSTFKNFRIKELDWWINLENSPNEIENKQGTVSLNFSFDWNKLINSRWKTIIDATDVASWIAWWTILWLDKIDSKVYFPVKKSSSLSTELHFLDIDSNLNYQYWWRIKTAQFIYTDSISSWTTYSFTAQAYNWVSLLYTLYPSFTAWPSSTIDNLYDNLLTDLRDWSWYFACTKWFTRVNWVEKYWIFVFVTWISWTDILTISSVSNLTRVQLSWWYMLTNSLWPIAKTIKSWSDLVVNLSSWNTYFLQNIQWLTVDWWSIFFTWYYIYEINIDPYDILYYNWKLLYCKDWDNILYFSKTSSATDSYLVTDFSWYDWWLQRIWWDWKITWLISWENWIYVFKEDEVYYSNSIREDWESFVFVFNRITNTGAKNPQCIARVWQDIFYYDAISRKIRRLSYEQNITQLRDTAISHEVNQIVYDYPLQQNYHRLNYFYPNVKLYTQSNPATNQNNQALTYNVDRKSWTTETVAVKWAWYDITFDEDNKLYREETSYKSEWEFKSKEYDLWDAIMFKRFWDIEIYWKNPDEIDLFLDVYIDWDLYETFTISNNFWDYFRERFDIYQDWRYIQFWIRYEWIWYIEINEVNISYKWIKNFIDYQW